MTILIYSKPSCIQCLATFRAFDRKGIPYKIIDISKDKEAFSFVTQLGYCQVPVVFAGNQRWSGFLPEMINRVQ